MKPNAAIACGVALVFVLCGAARASSLELITRMDSNITNTEDVQSYSISDPFQSGQFTLSDSHMYWGPPGNYDYGQEPWGAMGPIPFSVPVDVHVAASLFFVPPGTPATAPDLFFNGPPYPNAPEIGIDAELKGYLKGDDSMSFDRNLNVTQTSIQFSVSSAAQASLSPSLIAAFTDPSRVQVSAYLNSGWPTNMQNTAYITLTIAPPSPGDPQTVPEPSTCVVFAGLALGLLVRGRRLGSVRP